MARGKRSPYLSYCIVRDDPRVREIIKFKMKGRDRKKVCEAVGINEANYVNFINRNRKNVSQYKIIALLMELGVITKVVFETYDVDSKKDSG